MKINSRRPRGFEALAPTAQMFHGLGKGLSRGRGPRLAEVAVPKKEQPVETRKKPKVRYGTLVNVDGGSGLRRRAQRWAQKGIGNYSNGLALSTQVSQKKSAGPSDKRQSRGL